MVPLIVVLLFTIRDSLVIWIILLIDFIYVILDPRFSDWAFHLVAIYCSVRSTLPSPARLLSQLPIHSSVVAP